jgi:predicted transcriptional regulator
MGRPPGKKLTVNFTLRLDEETKRALDEVAAKEDRAPVAMARLLLREALKARQVKQGKPPTPPRKKKSKA